MSKTEKFKELLRTEKSILLPVAHDALTARIIEKVGFKAFALGGFGIAASRFGIPDLGLLSFSEMLQSVREISNSVSIPMLADADTGYGGVLNIFRTVKEYEKAGAALMFIEDQTFPKRCGHLNGKEVIPPEEMVAKIKVAVKARTDKDFLIVARTDAAAIEGIDGAIKRGNLYAKAGADVVFVEAPETLEELTLIPKQITSVPLLTNMMEGGKTPVLPQKELEEMGYKLIAWPISTLLASAKASELVLGELLKNGTTKGVNESLTSFSEIKELLDLPSYNDLEKSLSN